MHTGGTSVAELVENFLVIGTTVLRISFARQTVPKIIQNSEKEHEIFRENDITKFIKYIVVSTNKRSQAEVFTVYFSLKYLECNNYNVHSALNPLT